jgi:hypothetical protein
MLTEPALLFQAADRNSHYPDGLVEIVSEVKGFPLNRRFIVQYIDPWLAGSLFIAYGSELQLTT